MKVLGRKNEGIVGSHGPKHGFFGGPLEVVPRSLATRAVTHESPPRVAIAAGAPGIRKTWMCLEVRINGSHPEDS